MNYPQTASCCNNVAGGIDGLTSGHAYSLLDIVDLMEGGKVVQKLAKMRNPWSKEGYNGPWNDNDTRWTEEFKQQAGLVIADDGVFHMPYKNYVKFFQATSVAMVRDYAA